MLFAALFLNTDAAAYSGVNMLTTVAFTPLILAVFIRSVRGQVSFTWRTHRTSIVILMLTVIILTVKLLNGEDVLRILVNFTIIPLVLIPISFYNVDKREKRVFRNVLLCFYLVECGLALIERILSKRFFDTIFTADRYDYSAFEQYTWQFRSTSLLGHPLENAMAVSVMMVFILLGNMKLQKKIILFVMGYIALYCFNARGAIVICSLTLLPVLFNQIVKRYRRYSILTYIILANLFLAGGYLLITSNLSGRLFNAEKLMDESGQERLNVFSYLDYLPQEKLITGDIENYSYLLDKLGLVGIENGVITAVLLYGFLFGLPLLILLFYFLWEKLQQFGRKKRMLILIVFWSIGVMNPNLIDPTQWYILIFCLIAFKPERFYRLKAQNRKAKIVQRAKELSYFSSTLSHNV